MEKLRLFIAAAFMAALTGCPAPTNPMSDTGVIPDSGMPDDDGGTDPVDAGVDAYVPPGDSGTDEDAGDIPSVCEDPEFVGLMCNLPSGMTYRNEFTCGSFINNDQWVTDEVGATPGREFSHVDAGVLYARLSFAFSNAGMVMRTDVPMEFTCGNDGRCYMNCTNESSNYSCCHVSFLPDCSVATTECTPPGSTSPIISQAFYVGE